VTIGKCRSLVLSHPYNTGGRGAAYLHSHSTSFFSFNVRRSSKSFFPIFSQRQRRASISICLSEAECLRGAEATISTIYPPLSLAFSRLSFPKCAGFLGRAYATRPRAIISRGNLNVEFEGSAYFPRRRAPLITKHGRDFISYLRDLFLRRCRRPIGRAYSIRFSSNKHSILSIKRARGALDCNESSRLGHRRRWVLAWMITLRASRLCKKSRTFPLLGNLVRNIVFNLSNDYRMSIRRYSAVYSFAEKRVRRDTFADGTPRDFWSSTRALGARSIYRDHRATRGGSYNPWRTCDDVISRHLFIDSIDVAYVRESEKY